MDHPASKPEEGLSPANSGFFRDVNIEFLIHELKAPLSVIESTTRLLTEKLPENTYTAKQLKMLQRVLRNAQKARGMLYELLEVGRAEVLSFNCRAFNAASVVRSEVLAALEFADQESSETTCIQDRNHLLKELCAKGIRLDILPTAEDLTIVHDETKFRQVVGNLIKNALAYRRNGIIVHLAQAQARLIIAVRDDGPGIAPEHHEMIFERYKQVTPPAGVARSGHGLGLAISRILAKSMGGEITLESQLGQGAVFRLILPLQMQQESQER